MKPTRDETRIEGPTPNGGAYAIALRDRETGAVEIIEYSISGDEIMRTYHDPRKGGGNPRGPDV